MQTLILQVKVAEILGFQPAPRCCGSRDDTSQNKGPVSSQLPECRLHGEPFWFNDVFPALRREQRRVIKYKHGDPASGVGLEGEGSCCRLRKLGFDCGPAPAAGSLLGELWAPHIHQAGRQLWVLFFYDV